MTEPRYPIISDKGSRADHVKSGRYEWSDFVFLTQIGDYDLWARNQGRVPYAVRYAIVCAPEARKRNEWNITTLQFDDNGNLDLMDNDVEPDPYHMCLLYQAIAEHQHLKGE